MSLLEIKNLNVRFGDATAVPVVDGLDISVDKGEVLSAQGFQVPLMDRIAVFVLQAEVDFTQALGIGVDQHAAIEVPHENVIVALAQLRQRFLGALAGVSDPETKRKIVGREFIRSFRSALSQENWEEVSRQAHSFKSASRTIGAERLGQLGKELEDACHEQHPDKAKRILDILTLELQIVCAGLATLPERNN